MLIQTKFNYNGINRFPALKCSFAKSPIKATADKMYVTTQPNTILGLLIFYLQRAQCMCQTFIQYFQININSKKI